MQYDDLLVLPSALFLSLISRTISTFLSLPMSTEPIPIFHISIALVTSDLPADDQVVQKYAIFLAPSSSDVSALFKLPDPLLTFRGCGWWLCGSAQQPRNMNIGL
jgi:hypothetical protein